MNTYAGMEIYRHYFLISVLILNPYIHVLTALSSEETVFVTHFVGHLLGPRSISEHRGEKQSHDLTRNRTAVVVIAV